MHVIANLSMLMGTKGHYLLGYSTGMGRSFHLTVQVKPAQLNTSLVNIGLIVQVKPANSARLQSTLV